jgi:uncharacterized membrane protein YgcG
MVQAFSAAVLNHSRLFLWRAVAIVAIALAGMTGRIFAQDQDQAVAPPSAPAQLSEDQLENLVAPIALYPDPLLAVMLPASVYPLEIVQAARFLQDTNNLPQIDAQPWDDNVKAVAKYPTVIQKMNDDLQWTIQLGNAFADQPADLMNAIQTLRAKAQAAGTLKTTPEQIIVVTNAVVERTYQEQIVYVTNTVVEIQPANPQYIYVPVYNPVYVYYPPPGYVYYPTFTVGFRVVVTPYRCNWYYGGVYVGGGGAVVWGGRGPYHPPYYPCPPGYYRPPTYYPPPGYRPPPPGYRPPGYPPPRPPGNPGNRPPNSTLPAQRPSGPGGATTLPANNGQQWQPDPNRRQNAGSGGSRDTAPSRGWGSNGPSTQPAPGTGVVGNRPNTGTAPGNPNVGNRPAQQPGNGNAGGNQPGNGNRPNTGNGGNNPSPGTMPSNNRPAPSNPPSGNRPAQPSGGSRDSAFGSVGNGNDARNSSNRGSSSRGGGGGGGAPRGGGGGGARGGGGR